MPAKGLMCVFHSLQDYIRLLRTGSHYVGLMGLVRVPSSTLKTDCNGEKGKYIGKEKKKEKINYVSKTLPASIQEKETHWPEVP